MRSAAPVLRSQTATEDEKQAALSELLSPDSTFKQRLGLLDKALVSLFEGNASVQQCPVQEAINAWLEIIQAAGVYT